MRKFLSNFYYCKSGFSLMELMIVLLVVSIIAAATAPMIARKSARSAGGSGSAVGYLGIGNNFGNNGDGSLILGDTQHRNSKLYIDLDGKNYHIGFGNNGLLGYLKFGDKNGVVLGSGNASATGDNSIAIGTDAIASGKDSIAIGHNAKTQQNNSVSITTGTDNSSYNTNANQIILGDAETEVIIPGKLNLLQDLDLSRLQGTVTLGSTNSTIYMPGNLVVDRDMYVGDTSYLGYRNENTNAIWTRWAFDDGPRSGYLNNDKSYGFRQSYAHDRTESDVQEEITPPGGNYGKGGNYEYLRGITNRKNNDEFISDRRLKNVGEKFTGGLDEIKKLDLYNFTFKSDKAKTPQVGVMAQDLQKIFPNSVWEGADKYLRIRWDEMFYAVINAVRELDTKITKITTQVKANMDLITNMQAQIDEQKQEIQDLKAKNLEYEKQNAEILKRISKLEKRKKKSE